MAELLFNIYVTLHTFYGDDGGEKLGQMTCFPDLTSLRVNNFFPRWPHLKFCEHLVGILTAMGQDKMAVLVAAANKINQSSDTWCLGSSQRENYSHTGLV